MRLRSAANNQATRRNEIIKSYLQLGSSSNRYAPRLPQQETKSSTKQLAPMDPILGPENFLKTGFAQKGLPSNVIDTISKRWRRKKAFNTGGPSWWTWFWQLAQLLKKELQLLVIIRHLHLGPSQQCLVVLGQKTWVNCFQAFLSKLGWFSQTRWRFTGPKEDFVKGCCIQNVLASFLSSRNTKRRKLPRFVLWTAPMRQCWTSTSLLWQWSVSSVF